MKKAKTGSRDPYFAILWRNTPSEGVGLSAVQRLFGRRIRTVLPTENAVKTARRLLKKAKTGSRDPYFAIYIHWRNTPSEGVGLSAVQRLFGRRIRTVLPTAGSLLQPKAP